MPTSRVEGATELPLRTGGRTVPCTRPASLATVPTPSSPAAHYRMRVSHTATLPPTSQCTRWTRYCPVAATDPARCSDAHVPDAVCRAVRTRRICRRDEQSDQLPICGVQKGSIGLPRCHQWEGSFRTAANGDRRARVDFGVRRYDQISATSADWLTARCCNRARCSRRNRPKSLYGLGIASVSHPTNRANLMS